MDDDAAIAAHGRRLVAAGWGVTYASGGSWGIYSAGGEEEMHWSYWQGIPEGIAARVAALLDIPADDVPEVLQWLYERIGVPG